MPAAQAWRTLRYSSTLKILAPSLLSQKGKGWTTFTPPAAAPCRRFRGLISHRRSQGDYQSFLKDLISKTDPADRTFHTCLNILARAYYSDPTTQGFLFVVLEHGNHSLRMKSLYGLAHAINERGVRQKLKLTLQDAQLSSFREGVIGKYFSNRSLEKYRWLVAGKMPAHFKDKELSPIDFDFGKLYSDRDVLDTLVAMHLKGSNRGSVDNILKAYKIGSDEQAERILRAIMRGTSLNYTTLFGHDSNSPTTVQMHKLLSELERIFLTLFERSGVIFSFSGSYKEVMAKIVADVKRSKRAEEDAGDYFVFSRVTPVFR